MKLRARKLKVQSHWKFWCNFRVIFFVLCRRCCCAKFL